MRLEHRKYQLHSRIAGPTSCPAGPTYKGHKRHTGRITCFRISEDRSWIVSGSEDKTLKVWDTQSGAELFNLIGHSFPIQSLAISRDGMRIVSGSGTFRGPGEVIVWNAETGEQQLVLQGHVGIVSCVSISEDGKRIASGSSEHNNIKIWDSQSGQEKLTLTGDRGSVHCVAFSVDGKWIVSGGGEWNRPGVIRIWDSISGIEKIAIRGHRYPVTSICISQDGKQIVSGAGEFGGTGEIIVWDASDMTPVERVGQEPLGPWGGPPPPPPPGVSQNELNRSDVQPNTKTPRGVPRPPTAVEPKTEVPGLATPNRPLSGGSRRPSTKTVVTLLAGSAKQEWRYATSDPSAKWHQQDFDDSKWRVGAGGFGSPHTGARTEWDGKSIWLRCGFEKPDVVPDRLWLEVRHDEGFEANINGKKVASREGYVEKYVPIHIRIKPSLILREGRNVLAVHCMNTPGGPGFIDVRLKGRQVVHLPATSKEFQRDKDVDE